MARRPHLESLRNRLWGLVQRRAVLTRSERDTSEIEAKIQDVVTKLQRQGMSPLGARLELIEAEENAARLVEALKKNTKSYVHDESPIDYGLRPGIVQRFALLDDEVPGSTGRYFDFKSSDGWLVAFLDFTRSGADELHIEYIATRPDLRRQGLAADLLYRFVAWAEDNDVGFIHFGHVMSPTIWDIYLGLKAAYRAGTSAVDVHAKRDF